MGTLRLLQPAAGADRHAGEVYSCAYTPDGAYVLSGGWDGVLRLWDANSFSTLTALPASPKPLSCCTASPDGHQWLSGSMEGLLSIWDCVSHQVLQCFVAHTRPISSLSFSPDGQSFVTASWDRQISVRKVGKEREGRTFVGHQDIVAGCKFTVGGKQLISWSHDGTVKLWDLQTQRDLVTFSGHGDRITALALSPDGRWALSGSRDTTLRLWDLEDHSEVATVKIGAEVRACLFLPDGVSVVVADGVGRLFLMSAPTFEVQAQTQTPFKTMCGDLACSGEQLALGGEDGLVHFVAVEGFEDAALVVNATAGVKQQANLLDRFFGKTRYQRTWTWTCPACRHSAESNSVPTQRVACPNCRRYLRIHARELQLQGQ